jgi:hypothetical protein
MASRFYALSVATSNILYDCWRRSQSWVLAWPALNRVSSCHEASGSCRGQKIASYDGLRFPIEIVECNDLCSTKVAAQVSGKVALLFIESLGKIYYCPIRGNRLVDDSNADDPYQAVNTLQWSPPELSNGKTIKIKGFPKLHKVTLLRVVVSTNRTDWIVTNDLAQNSPDETQEACRIRWKIEQFHRELKQLTGVEKCPCRKARIQRNHIACAVMVWIRLADVARKAGQTIYRVKRGSMDGYLRQELKNPAVSMAFA